MDSQPMVLIAVLSIALTAAGAATVADRPADASPEQPRVGQGLPPPPGLSRHAKDYDIWVDHTRKLVVVDGEVVLRQGQLEMFACPMGTKEHESIVAVNCPARFVHASLLAVGAIAGHPVRVTPEYAPAAGPTVDIWVLWKDAEGKRHRVRAQEWVKSIRTGKAMEYSWVFAGSGSWKDETTGKTHYYADSGDFICVSNFPSATLDLPVKSSDANAELSFAAFTERIPPRGTKVRLVLIPRLDKPKKKQVESSQ